MAESTMDPSMWRERAQRAEAEVARLRAENEGLHLRTSYELAGLEQERDAAEDRLRKVALALSNHPRVFDSIDEEAGITCGWKRAVADVEQALAAPSAEGSKIPSSRFGEADRSAPEAAEPTGEARCPTCGSTGEPRVFADGTPCYDDRHPAPVSSGEAGTGEHLCLLSVPHGPHVWWYTSEGGGHMLAKPEPDAKSLRRWECPGITAPVVAPNAEGR